MPVKKERDMVDSILMYLTAFVVILLILTVYVIIKRPDSPFLMVIPILFISFLAIAFFMIFIIILSMIIDRSVAKRL